VPYAESKYWWQFWKKRPDDQISPDSKGNPSSEDANIKKITVLLERVERHFARYADENSLTNKRKEGWEIAEVMGLWAAAFVGVVAIIVGSRDSGDQRAVMQGQLNEMQAEQRPWIGGPNSVSGDLAKDGTVKFTMIFRNVGRTPSKTFVVDAVIMADGEGDGWSSKARRICADRIKKSQPTLTIIPKSD
jgi:hypothetical protein